MNIGMMFEWEKPPKDDPIGLVVSLNHNGKLVLGNSNIIGVVFDTPEILLNNPDEWEGKYVTDDYLRREMQRFNGEKVPKLIDGFDHNKSYDKRENRLEWSAVVTHGVVVARSVKPISGYKVGVDKAGNVVNGGSEFQVVEIVRQPQIKKGLLSSKVNEHGLVKIMVR